MTSHPPIRILVTGEYEDLDSRFPSELGHNGNALEWVPLAVLRFERLAVNSEIVKELVENPVDWIFFTSQRSVQFWAEVLMEQGVDFPLETQVACIGEKTAEAANRDGFTPDFYPTEPGTEKFLEEFEDLLGNNSVKPRIFIPMAEGARTTIRDRLRELGCDVTTVPLYRTLPREDLSRDMSQAEVEKSHLILFTSPSSVDAFTNCFTIPDEMLIGSLGKFTADYLTQKGFRGHRVLPEGDFERIGELL
jgi:uroporphyrinogen-III synthase